MGLLRPLRKNLTRTLTRSATWLASSFLTVASASSGQAVDPCKGCTGVEWEVERNLLSAHEVWTIAPESVAATNGEVFVVAPLEGVSSNVVVQDSLGNVTILGRSGDGPGEFRGIRYLSYADGRFHVFSNGRESIYDDALELITTRRIPVPIFGGGVVTDSGSVVQGFSSVEMGAAAVPLFHLVDERGVRSFGPRISPMTIRVNARADLHALGPGRDGGFWSAPRDEYRFQLWSAAGDPVLMIEPDAGQLEFPSVPPDQAIDPLSDPPPPAVVALSEDEHGHLWTAVAIPRHDWKRVAPAPGDDVRALRAASTETLIQMIDIATSRVLASQIIPRNVKGFLVDNRVQALRFDASGKIHLEILRLVHP